MATVWPDFWPEQLKGGFTWLMVREGVNPLVARKVWRLEYSPGVPGACVRAFHMAVESGQKAGVGRPTPRPPSFSQTPRPPKTVAPAGDQVLHTRACGRHRIRAIARDEKEVAQAVSPLSLWRWALAFLLQEMFTCHQCGKQLHSLAGMKYHVMANHNSLVRVSCVPCEPLWWSYTHRHACIHILHIYICTYTIACIHTYT